MLVQLAAGMQTPTSVYDLGLDNRTEADGLAVGQASELVASLMTPQLGGVFTVSDDELYLNLLALKDSLDAEVEPSAAAAVSGPGWLQGSAAGRAYAQGLAMANATHVIWATGGSLVPRDALRGFQEHARTLRRAARPEPPRSDIPRISGRAPADPQPIPGRPPYQQRHSKETTRERQRFPTAGRAATPDQQAFENATYRKVALRFIPFLMLCYVVAYLDRINIGIAKLNMLADLQFSEAAYGLGAGLFFIGYMVFEVPSNLIMHRVGARLWIARIMISWGILSGVMAFVTTPWQFYTVRFLLGVAEAGFYPGVILYLTYWFPNRRRAKMTAIFQAGIPWPA